MTHSSYIFRSNGCGTNSYHLNAYEPFKRNWRGSYLMRSSRLAENSLDIHQNERVRRCYIVYIPERVCLVLDASTFTENTTMTMFVYNNSCLIIHVLVCTDDVCVYLS